jgi:carbon storage regulator CsrA
MLVLQRKVDEDVVITVPPSTTATTIVVKLVRIPARDAVKLGFLAPTEVRILRAELKGKTDANETV